MFGAGVGLSSVRGWVRSRVSQQGGPFRGCFRFRRIREDTSGLYFGLVWGFIPGPFRASFRLEEGPDDGCPAETERLPECFGVFRHRGVREGMSVPEPWNCRLSDMPAAAARSGWRMENLPLADGRCRLSAPDRASVRLFLFGARLGCNRTVFSCRLVWSREPGRMSELRARPENIRRLSVTFSPVRCGRDIPAVRRRRESKSRRCGALRPLARRTAFVPRYGGCTREAGKKTVRNVAVAA